MNTTNTKIINKVNILLRKNSLFETLIYIAKQKKFIIPTDAEFLKSFWACRAIMAGGNDYRKKFNSLYIDMAMNYYFKLKEPFVKDDKLTNFFIRIYSEQLSYNLTGGIDYIARNIYIFYKLAKNKGFDFIYKKQKYRIFLHELFLKKNGMTILEYYKLAWIINCYSHNYGFIDKSSIVSFINKLNTQLEKIGAPECKTNITSQAIDNFFKILGCNYSLFRKIYNEINRNLPNDYIKSCFNPLNIYPIIETQRGYYIIPSQTMFLRKAFNLFWYFEDNIEYCNKNIFREKIFNKLFEEYVCDCFSFIYSKLKIYKITNYKSNDDEFFDLIIEDKNNAYLIEVKAYSLNVENYKTGDIEQQILNKIIKKPLGQMFKRVQDLYSKKYAKLNHLIGKNIKPICIYFDLPFVNSFCYKIAVNKILEDVKYRKEILQSIGGENNFDNFVNFDYFLLNIEELEKFLSLSHKITLDDFLNKSRNNMTFEEIKEELNENNNNLISPVLMRQFDEFCNMITPIQKCYFSEN